MEDTKAQVYARIRPHAKEGGHAARRKGDQQKDVKRLGKFDGCSVTMHGGKGEHTFDYLDGVILPPEDQEATYEALGMNTMLDRFLAGYNVTFLAYGQTGTGKTHTMFGSELNKLGDFDLESKQMPELWGLFPRALVSAMERLKDEDESKGQFKLTAQVMELYFGGFCDLLNENIPLNTVSRTSLDKWAGSDFGAFGLTDMEVATPADIAKIIKVITNNRSTRKTGMNDTSSRSHCIASICLTRVQEHPENGRQVRRCTFMFADLAGSERLDKTGLELQKAAVDAMEGLMTNWDLYNFGRCIDLTVEAKKKGKKPAKFMLTFPSMLAQVMTKVISGNSFLTMVVCLSQSDKNGGETWFSLEYGQRICELTASVSPTTARNYDTLLRDTAEALESERAALARLESTPAGRSNKWHCKRVSMVDQLTAELAFLTSLKNN